MKKIIFVLFVFLSLGAFPVLAKNEGKGSGAGRNALEYMSVVASQVQQLLQLKTSGGIGEQVREIAQEQNQAQNQIRDQINKLENKNDVFRFLFGPSNNALKNLKTQLVQNMIRITKLEKLKTQLPDEEDKIMMQEAIQALAEQNVKVQETILNQESVKGLFRFFGR